MVWIVSWLGLDLYMVVNRGVLIIRVFGIVVSINNVIIYFRFFCFENWI